MMSACTCRQQFYGRPNMETEDDLELEALHDCPACGQTLADDLAAISIITNESAFYFARVNHEILMTKRYVDEMVQNGQYLSDPEDDIPDLHHPDIDHYQRCNNQLFNSLQALDDFKRHLKGIGVDFEEPGPALQDILPTAAGGFEEYNGFHTTRMRLFGLFRFDLKGMKSYGQMLQWDKMKSAWNTWKNRNVSDWMTRLMILACILSFAMAFIWDYRLISQFLKRLSYKVIHAVVCTGQGSVQTVVTKLFSPGDLFPVFKYVEPLPSCDWWEMLQTLVRSASTIFVGYLTIDNLYRAWR